MKRPGMAIRFGSVITEPPHYDDEAIRGAIRAMVEQGALFAKALWYQRAQDLNIRRSGAYLQGIQDAQPELVSERMTPGTIEVVFRITNRAPHAAVIEDGHAAFHLASVVNWSGPNVKQGKGGPYLHIPFRHPAFQTAKQQEKSGMTADTRKAMMPADVYAKARRLQPKARLADPRSGPDAPGRGLQNQRAGLGDDWRGERVIRQGHGGLGGPSLVNPAWKSSRYAGMMKRGPAGHTSYGTIRTLTPNSLGWNIPAQPGHGVARQVAATLSGNGIGGNRFRELLVGAARSALGVR